MNPTLFTPEERARIESELARGDKPGEIAARLATAARPVTAQIICALRLRLRRAASQVERRCLCCGKPFASTGPGNRLCVHCRQKDDGGPLWRYAV